MSDNVTNTVFINADYHALISQVLNALNTIPQDSFSKSDMFINVTLIDKYGEIEVDFTDEFGEWGYVVTRTDSE